MRGVKRPCTEVPAGREAGGHAARATVVLKWRTAQGGGCWHVLAGMCWRATHPEEQACWLEGHCVPAPQGPPAAAADLDASSGVVWQPPGATGQKILLRQAAGGQAAAGGRVRGPAPGWPQSCRGGWSPSNSIELPCSLRSTVPDTATSMAMVTRRLSARRLRPMAAERSPASAVAGRRAQPLR